MKKMVLLIVSLLILLTACSKSEEIHLSSKTNEQFSEGQLADSQENIQQELAEAKAETNKQSVPKENDMEEFANLATYIEMDNYQMEIQVDNLNKRIILFKNKKNANEEWKSIFIKDSGRLKIIEFNKGVIFNKEIS